MKIIIFYASFGGGHLSASKSIKQYIDEHYKNAETLMIDAMKYVDKGFEKISTETYKIMVKNVPWIYGGLYKASAKGPIADLNNLNNIVLSMKLKKLLKEEKPDLIINTHPFASQMTAFLKRTEKIDCKIATIITDFHSHNQWLVNHKYIDYLFVSNEKMKQAISETGIDSDKIYVTGIPLSNRFLLHFNREEIKKSFNLDLNKRTILFFAGGEFGLGKTTTLDILKAFLNNLHDTYQLVAIAGRNEKLKQAFTNIIEDLNVSDKAQVLGFSDQIPELMSISDLVVTKPGGLTSTESLASGLPIIAINPIPGQEVENAEFLEESKVAIWIKKHDNFDEKIKEILSDEDKLYHMKVQTKLLAKKNSTANICKILLKNSKNK